MNSNLSPLWLCAVNDEKSERTPALPGESWWEKESSRNERDAGQPFFKKRENWVALGAADERTSRALLPLSTMNQEGK